MPQTYAGRVTARLRPELADIPAYTPGKTVPGAIKIASNETVYGPLPSVRAAIEKATDSVNRYPDNGYLELRDHLAKHVDFPPEHDLGGVRLGEPVPAADPDHLDRRRRGGVRLAKLRDLPAAGPHRGRHPGAGAADRPHLRLGRDGRKRSPTAPGWCSSATRTTRRPPSSTPRR